MPSSAKQLFVARHHSLFCIKEKDGKHIRIVQSGFATWASAEKALKQLNRS
jgi:hypothetical protein